MKTRTFLIRCALFLGVCFLLFLLFAPFYLKQSLIHWYPDLDDYKIFHNDTVAIAQPTPWKYASNYNKQSFTKEDLAYLKSQETTAFLVIQDGKILHESYWDGGSDSTLSNLFSATKSIVGLLIGIAIDEGKIKSVDECIGQYIPEFSNDERGNITIRNLLTMSSGLNWNEIYTSPFSITTQAYYGNNLRKLTTQQKIITTPGKRFKYLSGDTQLLSYIVEKATGVTVSKYAQEKIWKPMGAEHPAIWSKDGENGDERAFCCFHTNAKDIARIGQLVLNRGMWNGKRIISESYINETTQAKTYLLDREDNELICYGYQWWILPTKENGAIPYMRGHKGQYIYSIPKKNAVVVRLGEKKPLEEIKYITEDITRYLEIGLSFLE